MKSLKEIIGLKVRKKKDTSNYNGFGKVEITGNVELIKNFSSSNGIQSRDIIVWLPPSYKKNKEETYPVLYMHDGQNLFDPKTAYIGIDWRVDETVTKLIKAEKINEIIIVGIYNSPDRVDEYSNTDRGKLYSRFIIDDLKTYIDKNFRTKADRKNTAIMGSSMGGLISFLMAWNRPDVFSMAGCLSSSFYYQLDYAVNLVKSYEGQKKPIKFYIDHGEDGIGGGQRMFVALSNKGYVVGTDLDYYYDTGAQHTENAWAERLHRSLIFFFGKK